MGIIEVKETVNGETHLINIRKTKEISTGLEFPHEILSNGLSIERQWYPVMCLEGFQRLFVGIGRHVGRFGSIGRFRSSNRSCALEASNRIFVQLELAIGRSIPPPMLPIPDNLV